MKTLTKTLLALTAGTLMTAGANAALYQHTSHNAYAGQPYVGVKAGQVTADVNNVDNDNATVYGIYGGYNFDPNFGVEAEYVGSDKEKVNGFDVKGHTFGAYGTYRMGIPNVPVYGKAKLGIAQAKGEVSTTGYSSDASKTGVAGGLGLGFNATPNIAVEAEYDWLPSVENIDTNLWTIGAHYKF
ncbi:MULTISPECIES: porin family protein [unclassified Moraxella]|uniref:porin family protein n=1 Tax=unclassified Moraxella TaxID=2685852 RepID=UPI003AF7DD41